MTTLQLQDRLTHDAAFTLVDVREPDEYKDWHIPGAKNIPVGEIVAGAVPSGAGGVVTICAHGPRSKKAAEALQKRGIHATFVEGGMVAWNSTYQRADVPSTSARVIQIKRLGKACLSYVVVSDGQALVIDPSVDADEYRAAAKEAGAQIKLVVDTHAHADHVSGARILAQATGAAYWAPAELGEKVARETLREGSSLEVGRACLRVMETPGHTPGSLTLVLNDLAFTGDTLFAQSVGRPDLGQDPRPNARVLFDSLHERLLTLPHATRVLPAHAGGLLDPKDKRVITATIGALLAAEAPLQMPVGEFVEWVAQSAGAKPANFSAIKRINRGEDPMPEVEDVHELEAGPNRCAVG